MADINKLKDKIKSTIYPNGKGAINASDHQAMLLDMADGMAETGTKLTELSAEISAVTGEVTTLNPMVSVEQGYVSESGEIVIGGSSWKLYKYDIGDAVKIRVTCGTPAAQSTPYCAFYADSNFTQVVGTPIVTANLAGKTTDIDVPKGAHYFAGSIVFIHSVDVSTIVKLGTIDELAEEINSVKGQSQLSGYYECASVASASTKVITGDYTQISALTSGSHFLLKMANAHSASFAEINVNSLGAKRLYYNGAPSTPYNTWEAGEMLDVYFDGTNFQAVNYNNSILVERVSARDAIFSILGFVDKSGTFTNVSSYQHTDFIPYFSGNRYRIKGYESNGDRGISACACFDKNKVFIGNVLSGSIGEVEFILDDTNIVNGTAYFIVNKYVSYTGYVEALSTYDVLRELYRMDDTIEARAKQVAKLSIAAANWEIDASIREKSLRQLFLDSGEQEKWYGVEWKEDSDADNVVPINSMGDEDLHIALPIQNKMRRCVVKNGFVKYYLDADNSEFKADGTPANLDGTDGDVMVEIPEFFFKCEEEMVGDVKVVRLKISEQGLAGFKYSRKVYTSAYEATINRTTNILASVCTTLFTRTTEEVKSEDVGNYIVGNAYSFGTQQTASRKGFSANAANFRGGTNDATLDAETNPSAKDYSRNQLGIPVSNINRKDAREYADKYNNIFVHQYDTQKKLWILAQVEFKSRNIQKPIADGGMGTGATMYPDYNAYEAFFKPQRGIACIPCGVTNSLGNHTGEVYFKMVNVPVQSTGTAENIVYNRFSDVWMPVMSYRGVENFYGHIYKIVDGVNVRVTDTGTYVNGHSGDSLWKIHSHAYYYEPNPLLTTDEENADNSLGTYVFPSNIMSVSQLMLGEDAHILHTGASGKDMNANYCDASELLPNTRLEFITFNGRIVSGNLVGFHFIVAADAANGFSTRPSDGTRIDMF